MLGDDLTDEYGFDGCDGAGRVRRAGRAPRETAARYGLADVDAVLTWLEAVRVEGAR